MGHQTQTVDQNPTSCRNCGEAMVGPYCHACGQKHLSGRLSTRALFGQLFEAFTETDGTIWQTLRKLARNPGKVALEYIEGSRARYLNPVRFLLVTFAIYLGLMVITGAQLDIASRFFASAGERAVDANVRTFITYATNIIVSQMDLVIWLVIPVLALLVRWQYWRAGRNYAETFTYICFVFGLGYLYASILIPVQFLLDQYSPAPKNILTGGLFVYGARVFFDISWFKALVGSLISAGLYFLAMAVVTILVAFVEIILDRL